MTAKPVTLERVDFALPIHLPGPRSKLVSTAVLRGERRMDGAVDDLLLLVELGLVQLWAGDDHTEIPLAAVRQLRLHLGD